jgi:16S rRNA (uracil1498-N3)-methyltransferase
MQRYFLTEDAAPLTVGESIVLPDTSAIHHHFARVLRAKVGSQAEFVHQQQVFLGEVVAIEKASLQIALIDRLPDQSIELPFQITVVVSPLKNDRSDWFVQKATELGVHQIVFTQMARTVANWQKQQTKKQERLEKIALAAAEQSHRLQVPTIQFLKWSEVVSLDKNVGLVAWEESARAGETSALIQHTQTLRPQQQLILLFGPEGGLTAEEIQQLIDANYHTSGLGPRILRAETAPLYALSALSVLHELNH